MTTAEIIARLGAGLAIGLLVGMEREYAKRDDAAFFAGARTFALIGLCGGLAALAGQTLGETLVVAAAFLVIGLYVGIAYYFGAGKGEIGQTTEIAALVVFLAGVVAMAGEALVAAGVGVATMAVLSSKSQTDRFAGRINDEDVRATVKFAVLAGLVLPLLPREPIGPAPFDATSPFNIGLMVVLISGLSFAGYVLMQLVGPRRGLALTGILGGLVSSTAATVTLSRQSRLGAARHAAVGLLLAWAIMFARVMIELLAVNPSLLGAGWPALAAGGGVCAATAGVLYLLAEERAAGPSTDAFANPFRLRPAIEFGLLYGAVVVASAAAAERLGSAGLYLAALVSGIVDVDAITLSMAELARTDASITTSSAALAIAIAAATNTMVKCGIVLVLGSKHLRKVILPTAVVATGATLLLAALTSG